MSRPATIDWYERMLKPFIEGDYAFTNFGIIKFQKRLLGTGKSYGTIASHTRAIRAMLCWMDEEELIQKLVKFEFPRVEQKFQEVYSRDEINQLLEYCKGAGKKALTTLKE